MIKLLDELLNDIKKLSDTVSHMRLVMALNMDIDLTVKDKILALYNMQGYDTIYYFAEKHGIEFHDDEIIQSIMQEVSKLCKDPDYIKRKLYFNDENTILPVSVIEEAFKRSGLLK